MKKIYPFLFAILLLSIFSGSAQNTDGTDFWLTFGVNNGQSASGVNLQIRIVSRDFPTTVTITFNQTSPSIPPITRTLAPRSVETITLDSGGGSWNTTQRSAVYNNSNSSGTSFKSIYIHSTEPITAYAINQATTSTDATNILPEPALDTSYYHISYNRADAYQDAYAVIATANDTKVYHEGSQVATLSRGEVYYRRAGSVDMTGSHITSDKPVAFFVVHERAMIPVNVAARDNLFQQLAPVKTWGSNFFVPVSHLGIDRVRIVASQPGTIITRSGGSHKYAPGGQTGPVYTLNPGPGQYIEFEVNLTGNGCYIQSDKPIGVCNYLTGSDHVGSSVSDPAECWLPSIEQTANQALIAQFYLPKAQPTYPEPTHYALIITPDSTKNSTTVTIGTRTPVSLFGGTWRTNNSPLPGMEPMAFYTFPLTISDSSYIFKNQQAGLLVMGYGVAYAESYCYLGYSSMRKLDAYFTANNVHNQDLTNELLCTSDPIPFSAVFVEPENVDTLIWYLNGVTETFAQDSTWSHTFSPGEYSIKMEVHFVSGDVTPFEATLNVGAVISAVSDNPAWGTVSLADTCVYAGETVTLTATPAPFYAFKNWEDEAADGLRYTLTEPATYSFQADSNRNLRAVFELDIVEITSIAQPSTGGNTAVSGGIGPEGNLFQIGDSATVVATPNEPCYYFLNWTDKDGFVSADSVYKFEVTEARELIANFGIYQYTISPSISPLGSGTVTDTITYNCGANAFVVVAPLVCFHFIEWRTPNGDFVTTDNPYFFNVDSARDLVAILEPGTYTIQVSASDGGTATITPGGTDIPCNTPCTVTATPHAPLYKFSHWEENGKKVYGAEANYSFSVTGDRYLVAVFEKETIIVKAIAEPGTGGMANSGCYEIALDDTCHVWAEPSTCNDFLGWKTLDNYLLETDTDYYFTVLPDLYSHIIDGVLTLVAHFQPKDYDITLTPSPYSGGDVYGGGNFPCGAEIEISAKADHPIYKFVKWVEILENDTVWVSNDSIYTFKVICSRNLIAIFELEMYDIVVLPNPDSGGNAWEGGKFPYGTHIEVHADPFSAWTFFDWTEDGVHQTDNKDYPFTVFGSRTLYANFIPKTYSVTVSPFPPMGGSAQESGVNIPYDTMWDIWADPNPTYEFSHWEENGTLYTWPAYYQIPVIRDYDLKAVFTLKQYEITLEADPPVGGTLLGAGTYEHGTSIEVEAIAGDCYTFSHWTEDGKTVSLDFVYSFEVTAPRHLVAHFIPTIYEITLFADPNVGGTGNGGGSYACQTEITITANPEYCYEFLYWEEDGEPLDGIGASYTFTVTGPRILTAFFAKTLHDISVSATEGGEATGDAEDYECGNEWTVSAFPDECYRFLYWTEDGSEVSYDQDYNFIVEASRDLIAHFEFITYNIEFGVNILQGGSVSSKGGIYDCGDTVTVCATANEFYNFINWTDRNGTIISEDTCITVIADNDYFYIANFEIYSYEITLECDPQGAGNLTGAGIYAHDTWIEISVTANPEYYFLYWTEADTLFSDNPTFEISVTSSRHFIAHFEANHYAIVLLRNPVSGGSVEGAGSYPYGKDITVKALPNSFNNFVMWTENDSIVPGAGAAYTFTVDSARTLTAHFEPKTYTVTLERYPIEGGEVVGGGSNIEKDTMITVLAIPNPEYDFAGWYEEDVPVWPDTSYSFIVNKDRHLVAHFTLKKFTVNLSVIPPLGGIPVGGGTNIEYGDIIPINVVTNIGYRFLYWKEDTITVSSTQQFDLQVFRNQNLTAYLGPEEFTITLSADLPAGGTLSGDGTFAYEEMDTVKASPNPSYTFNGWTENGNPVWADTLYAFPVTSSRHLVANFSLETYHVYLSANPPEGGWTEGGGNNIQYGTIDTIKANANPDYDFAGWYEDDMLKYTSNPHILSVNRNYDLVAHFTPKNYTITLEVFPAGAGTVSGDGTFPYQTIDTLWAKANEKYEFKYWSEDTLICTANPYFFPVTRSRHLTANFALETYDVILTKNPEEGGEVTGGGTDITWGTSTIINAIPNPNYSFAGWYENDQLFSPDPWHEFSVTEPHNLEARFIPNNINITLEAVPVQGGVPSGGGAIPYNTVTTISANPDECYDFLFWIPLGVENDTIFSADFELLVEEERAFTAYYEQKIVAIATEANPTGTGNTTAGDETDIPCGTYKTVYAYSTIGYKFVNWTKEGVEVSQDAAYHFKTTESCTLVANFEYSTRKIDLQWTPLAGGKANGEGDYPNGDTITVHAIPNTEYKFVKWTEDDEEVSQNADYEFIVDKDRTLKAHFVEKTLDVTVSPEPSYGGTAKGDQEDILYGTKITVEAEPSENFVFVNWTEKETGNEVSKNAKYEFPVVRSINLLANFALTKHNVILSADPQEGGAIEGGGTGISYGETTTIKATANEFYSFTKWTEDGEMFSTDATHTFTVKKSHNLVAIFTAETTPITLLANPQEGGTLEGGGDIPKGKETTIIATPDICYDFINWTENGNEITKDTEYTFIVGEEARTFIANFRQKTVTVTTAANISAGGTTTGDAADIPCGTEITVSAITNPEYNFINWTKGNDVVSTDADYTFKTTESCNLVANFTPNIYTVTVQANPPELGTVSGGGNFSYGEEITVSAIHKENYTFVNWTENGAVVSTDADYKFIVKGSRSLTAHFDVITYTVNVYVNDTVYGYATGAGVYEQNSMVQVKAFPIKGYQFDNWTRDGLVVSNSTVYEFTVTENVNLVANFYGLDFDMYALTLWDNTFMLNLKKFEDEGFDIIGCKWFKNGKEEIETYTVDDYSYSAGPNKTDFLELAPTYYMFQITTKTSVMFSTKKVLANYDFYHAPANKNKLFVYPNPALSGNSFTVEGVVKDTPVEVYNQYGVCIRRTIAHDETITLALDLPAGLYLIRNHNKDAKITIVK